MKKIIFVACACLMFLSVMLTGCEDDGDDSGFDWDEFWETEPPSEDKYVTVTMSAHFYVADVKISPPSPPQHFPYGGAEVQATFSKNGVPFDRQAHTTSQYGTTDASATLKVWEGESVEFTGAVWSWVGPLNKRGDSVSNGYGFTWEEIWQKAGKEWGSSIAFSRDLSLVTIN